MIKMHINAYQMLKTNYTFFFSIEFIFCVGGLAGGMVVITATLSPVLGMITSSYVVSRASVPGSAIHQVTFSLFMMNVSRVRGPYPLSYSSFASRLQ